MLLILPPPHITTEIDMSFIKAQQAWKEKAPSSQKNKSLQKKRLITLEVNESTVPFTEHWFNLKLWTLWTTLPVTQSSDERIIINLIL